MELISDQELVKTVKLHLLDQKRYGAAIRIVPVLLI